MRAVIDCNVSTVIRYSTVEAAGVTVLSITVSWVASGRPRMRWHLQQGRQIIPKSVTPTRIAENFEIFDFELTQDELGRIDALESGVRGGRSRRKSRWRPLATTSPRPDALRKPSDSSKPAR